MVSVEKNGEIVNYAEMVRRLFKPMDGVGARMMHACIGIAGESGEIRTAATRANLLEECGDSEFYIEAAWQELPEELRREKEQVISLHAVPVFGDINAELHRISSELLDHAKKVWVYGGAKGKRDEQIADLLIEYEHTLGAVYHFLGVQRQDVQLENMLKLFVGKDGTAARYASGQYSDAEALNRADKPAERKFMTDTPKS
jgi:hypothetical protein